MVLFHGLMRLLCRVVGHRWVKTEADRRCCTRCQRVEVRRWQV
jgi:hypothetical protein